MKRTIQFLIIFLLIISLGFFGLQIFVEKKIKSALEKLVEEDKLSYSGFNFSLIKSDFSVDSLTFFEDHQKIFSPHVRIDNIKFSKYLFKKDFKAGKVLVKSPVINLVKHSEENKKSKETFENQLFFEEIKIEDAQLFYKEDTLTKLKLKDYSADLKKIKLNKETFKNVIPFEFESYSISGGFLWYQLDYLQTLTAEKVHLNNDQIDFEQLKVIPNYSRQEYVKVIPHEKDLMDLKIESLKLKDYKIGQENDQAFFKISKGEMQDVNFQVFRNKLVKDDPTKKKMYSQMLRDLPIGLEIENLKVKNAYLSYEEVQEETGQTGKVFFTNMNVEVNSLTNIDLERKDFPETVVSIDCNFLGAGPLEAIWTFKVNNLNDEFHIKGKGANIPPEKLNSFFEAAYNMNAKGENIKAVYFDFYGDKKIAQGEYHMVYDDLKVDVLRKTKGQEKNKIYSFFANLLMSHKNESGDQVVKVSDVERDPTRSFWNYFWNCIFSGLKETLI